MGNQIETIVARYPRFSRESLIPALQALQAEQGYLTEEALQQLSNHLQVPTSEIYGLATFYDQFRFFPGGKAQLTVCRGTSCHLNHSDELMKDLEKLLKTKAGQRDPDGRYSLDTCNCKGCCQSGPVVEINGKLHTQSTLPSIKEALDKL